MTEEKWKQYKDTTYWISSLGRAYNTKTKRFLKGTCKRNEYHTVQFVIDGKPKSFMTHRLVAELFCKNPNNYSIVDHIDRNKYNNCYTNLRWTSPTENVRNRDKSTFVYQSIEYVDNLDGFEELCFGKGKYLISKEGIVINSKTHRILKGSNKNGYQKVFIDGDYYFIHILVWRTFVGDIEPGMVIDHIDGNRQNNKLENLRKVTQSENMYNAYLNGHKAKKKVYQYNFSGELVQEFDSLNEASKQYDCTAEAISSAIKREGSCVGYFWSYEKRKETPEELKEFIAKNTVRSDAIGVSQYDKDGIFIKHYLSLAEAAKSVKCSPSTISRGNRAKRKAKGYFWIFDSDDYTIEELIK